MTWGIELAIRDTFSVGRVPPPSRCDGRVGGVDLSAVEVGGKSLLNERKAFAQGVARDHIHVAVIGVGRIEVERYSGCSRLDQMVEGPEPAPTLGELLLPHIALGRALTEHEIGDPEAFFRRPIAPRTQKRDISGDEFFPIDDSARRKGIHMAGDEEEVPHECWESLT